MTWLWIYAYVFMPVVVVALGFGAVRYLDHMLERDTR